MKTKYEQLIEFIINEEEDKARALFHEIVVEKSREIYESLIDEEDLEEAMGGDDVEDMVDEITDEENEMHEEEDLEAGDDSEEAEEHGDEEGEDSASMDLDTEIDGEESDEEPATKIEDLVGQDIGASFICVPTPMGDDGSIDSSIVESCVTFLKQNVTGHIIINVS